MGLFKLSITNNGPDDLVVWVEPWANDFTLESGENILLLADSEEPFLDLTREKNTVQVYLNSSTSFIAEQGGVPIKCGHKRKMDQ